MWKVDDDVILLVSLPLRLRPVIQGFGGGV